MYSLNCKGRLIDLSTPRIMGIINVTPDSFYDGGKTTRTDEVLRQAETMLNEGATFLDIGGYSSRPGADDVALDEELRRVISGYRIIDHFVSRCVGICRYLSKQSCQGGNRSRGQHCE